MMFGRSSPAATRAKECGVIIAQMFLIFKYDLGLKRTLACGSKVLYFYCTVANVRPAGRTFATVQASVRWALG